MLSPVVALVLLFALINPSPDCCANVSVSSLAFIPISSAVKLYFLLTPKCLDKAKLTNGLP